MLDPGALGTLIIGLRANGVELDFGYGEEQRSTPAGTQRQLALQLLARSLRWLADRLEPNSLETEPAR
jgi:hypothetical protein